MDGCAAVYLLSMLIGVLVLNQGLFSGMKLPSPFLFSVRPSFFWRRQCQRFTGNIPPPKEKRASEILSSEHSVILLTGIFMILLGFFLVPVSLGMLPFAGSAQLGLLMVIMALKMISTGNTPIGAFRRTRLVVICGSFSPAWARFLHSARNSRFLLTLLIGLLNIFGGIIGLRGTLSGLRKQEEIQFCLSWYV